MRLHRAGKLACPLLDLGLLQNSAYYFQWRVDLAVLHNLLAQPCPLIRRCLSANFARKEPNENPVRWRCASVYTLMHMHCANQLASFPRCSACASLCNLGCSRVAKNMLQKQVKHTLFTQLDLITIHILSRLTLLHTSALSRTTAIPAKSADNFSQRALNGLKPRLSVFMIPGTSSITAPSGFREASQCGVLFRRMSKSGCSWEPWVFMEEPPLYLCALKGCHGGPSKARSALLVDNRQMVWPGRTHRPIPRA